jgi:hypothetical protein
MPVPQPLQSRLIGALFVERGLVSESQIRVALELQHETGQQLGQILVERFGVSRKELASVVAEQWAKLGGSAGPEDNASWRRLGEIFVDRGFVSQEELEQALERQSQTGERLGEALVAQGVISKFELAGALAEQMAALGETAAEAEADERPHATVHHFPRPEEPVEASVEPAEELEREPQPEPEPAGTLLEAVRDLERDEPSLQPEAEPEPKHEPAWGETVLEAVPEPGPEVELGPEPVLEEVHEPVLEVASQPELEDVPEPVLEHVPEPVLEVASQPELEDVPEPVLEHVPEPVLEEVDEAAPEVASEPEFAEVPEPGHEQVEAAFDAESSNGHAAPTEDVGEPLAVDTSVDGSAELAAAGIVLEEARKPEPAAACFAFAPTTRGYVLVPLVEVPSAGQTIDLADVGKRVVLRVGSSPIPMDNRVCAFVEEAVTPPLAATPEEQSPRRFAASLAGRPRPTLSL